MLSFLPRIIERSETAASETFGQRAVRIFIDVGIAVALGLLFCQLAGTVLEVLASRENAGAGGQPATRDQTFVPLVRAGKVAFIIAATGMIILACSA